MGKAVLSLILALVLLGFLISTTMHMYNEMSTLKAENESLKQELTQLQASYDTAVKDNNTLKNENTDLQNKMIALKQAYNSEVQVHLNVEAENKSLKAVVANLQGQSTNVIPAQCAFNQKQSNSNQNKSNLPVVAAGFGCLGFASFVTYRKLHNQFKHLSFKNK